MKFVTGNELLLEIREMQDSQNESILLATWRTIFWDIDIGDVIFVDGRLMRIIAGIPANLFGKKRIIAIVDNYVSEGIL